MNALHGLCLFLVNKYERTNNKFWYFLADKSASSFIFIEHNMKLCKGILISLVILATLGLSSLAFGTELTDLSIEYKSAIGTNRHWIIPEGEQKLGETNINMRIEGDIIYSQTRIETMFTNKQFRYGALDQEIGFKIDSGEVFYHHKSQHAFDYNFGVKYPNENSLGIRIKLK